VTLTQSGSGATVTATDHAGTGKTGTSNTFTVNAAALDHFKVAPAGGGFIGTQTAGTPFSVKVTAQDSFNNTVTGFTGTVDVTSNKTCSAGCVQSAAFTSGVLASHSVTLTQSGSGATVTATDHAGTGKTGTSNTFTVNASALDHLALTPSSSSITAGGSQGYTVEGFDVYNNSRGDVTAATTLSITPDGSCDNTLHTCTASVSGAHTVTGTDSTKTGTATLTVTAPAFTFSGFLNPVNNPPWLNTGKGGRTIPVKFWVKDASGNYVTSLSAVDIKYKKVTCGTWSTDPTDSIEAYATGGTILRNDGSQFIYNWSTPAAGCYVLMVFLSDGTQHNANFQFS